MANPQPDKFIKISRELHLAFTRSRMSGVENQVVDAITYLTYGAIPSVKEAQISNADICKLTGLSSVAVSKALKKLLGANRITKNGNYYPPKYGIQKDYEKWKMLPKKVKCCKDRGSQKSTNKPLPKLVTNVTQNGKRSEVTPILKKKEQEQIDCVYEFYKTEIQPLRKSLNRARKNIGFHLKKYPAEQLLKSIQNYKSIIDFDNDPKFRKDPANFFGKDNCNRAFVDFLPENFTQVNSAGKSRRCGVSGPILK